MQTEQTAEKLAGLMAKEIRLLKDFARFERQMDQKIQKKDWDGANAMLQTLKEKSVAIESLEETRHKTYLKIKKTLGLTAKLKFSDFLMHIEDSQTRRVLKKRHQALKEMAYKVKAISSNFRYYYQYILGALNELIGEIFPHQKGRFYSKEGKNMQGRTEPLMVNQKL